MVSQLNTGGTCEFGPCSLVPNPQNRARNRKMRQACRELTVFRTSVEPSWAKAKSSPGGSKYNPIRITYFSIRSFNMFQQLLFNIDHHWPSKYWGTPLWPIMFDECSSQRCNIKTIGYPTNTLMRPGTMFQAYAIQVLEISWLIRSILFHLTASLVYAGL